MESTCTAVLPYTTLRNNKNYQVLVFISFEFTSKMCIPIVTVATTTKTLVRINTKSPTEFMTATRKLLLTRILKACCPDLQKFLPYIAERKVVFFFS